MQRIVCLAAMVFAEACSGDNSRGSPSTSTSRDSGASAPDAVSGGMDAVSSGMDALSIADDAGVDSGFSSADSGVTATPDAGPIPDTGPRPSPGVCEPDPTQTGNSNNVGAYCSAGGQQCRQYDFARVCAVDVDPEGGNFCIKIVCSDHAACGEEACCTGRDGNPIRACVPKGCVTMHPTDPCPPVGTRGDSGVTD